jgi:hypothetical protein
MSDSRDNLEIVVEEAIEKIFAAIEQHEEEAHDGGYCIGERANIVAAFIVVLGIPQALVPLIVKQVCEMRESSPRMPRPGLN